MEKQLGGSQCDILDPLVSAIDGYDFDAALEQMEKLEAAIPQEPSDLGSAPLPEEALANLKELLEEDDTDAGEVIAELLDHPALASHRHDLVLLTEAVDGYDFDAALELFSILDENIKGVAT